MNIGLCSIFYNSVISGDLARYMAQIEALDWPHDALRVFTVEGDSTDDTWAQLVAWHGRDARVKCGKMDLHEPYMGSVDNPRRLWNCSTLGSYCREMALRDGWADAVLWLESDLLWEPDLLKRLTAHGVDIVAPWVLVARDGGGVTDIPTLRGKGAIDFYDSWAYRYLPDGSQWFGPQPPRPNELTEVYSAGSCLLMRSDAARASNAASTRAIVGWCERARDAGFLVWVDPNTEVWHPWPRGKRE